MKNDFHGMNYYFHDVIKDFYDVKIVMRCVKAPMSCFQNFIS